MLYSEEGVESITVSKNGKINVMSAGEPMQRVVPRFTQNYLVFNYCGTVLPYHPNNLL